MTGRPVAVSTAGYNVQLAIRSAANLSRCEMTHGLKFATVSALACYKGIDGRTTTE